MDTLTHALSGALAARAAEPGDGLEQRLPRRARLWLGFWAAAFPDSDFIVRFLDPFVYITTHRGVTHSVVMLPFWAAVLGLAVWWLSRRRYSYRDIAVVIGIGIGIHIVGDVITAFGTMVFAPLSDWRAQWPVTFIIDPWFTLIIVAGLVASAVRPATRTPAVIGLAALALYVGVQGLLRERAIGFGEQYAAQLNLREARIGAQPQPFSPFHWMVVVETPEAYRVSHISLWRSEPAPAPAEDSHWLWKLAASYQPRSQARWKTVARYGQTPEQVQLAHEAWQHPALERYRKFVQFPAVDRVDRTADLTCVWFQDIRFLLAGRAFPFRYGACRNGTQQPWQLHRLVELDGKWLPQAVPR
jgi:inner membrane protein